MRDAWQYARKARRAIEPTPSVLARPLAERMLRTNLSPSPAQGLLSWSRGTVRFMTYLFSDLPPKRDCAAAQYWRPLIRIHPAEHLSSAIKQGTSR